MAVACVVENTLKLLDFSQPALYGMVLLLPSCTRMLLLDALFFCMCVQVHVHVFVYTCGGQMTTSGAVSQKLSSLQQGLRTNSSRLVDH